MNTELLDHRTEVKNRIPWLAAFMSLISLGLGQVYNGEVIKGIMLNIVFWSAFLCTVFYTTSAYFGRSFDLIFLLITVSLFLILKIFSVGQAWIRARRAGNDYLLKKTNHPGVYTLFAVLCLVPPLFLSNALRSHSLRATSPHHPFRSELARREFCQAYHKRAARWPIPSETRMVGTSWGQTHVRISGPEEAPPLVLLHGGGTNSLQWMYNIEGLSKEHRTFAVDGILDTGLSVNTRRIERAEELVEWLEETLDGLGLDTGVDILGLSYGGWIAARFALVHPDRLNKLVLIAPAATVAPLSLTWIKKAVLTLIPHRHFTANFLHWLLPGFARNDPVEFNAVVDEAFLAIRCFKLADMVNPDVLTETEWEKITIPVLFLIGEKEKIHSLPARKVVERLNRIAPRVTKQVIPGAGHDLTVVRTELVNGVVLKFLRQ